MRIVILTYQSHHANRIMRYILPSYGHQVVGVVRSDITIAGKNTWQSLQFLLQQTGWGFVAWKGLEIILGRLLGGLGQLTGQSWGVPSLKTLCQPYNIPIISAKNVNRGDSLAQIKAWQPDLIVSVYFNQLIGKKLIALPSRGVINIHPALLPKNRGLFPYFWVLVNGDAESGVSVHWVEPKFDTGNLINQQVLPILPDDSVVSLARRSAEAGGPLLLSAIQQIEAGQAPHVAQNHAEASYHSWPTSADVRHLRQQGRRYGSLPEIWRDLRDV